MRLRKFLLAALVPLALGACDDDTIGPEGQTRIDVAFATTANTADDETVITGSNGTLVIEDIRMLVAEFELEGPEACMAADDDDGDMEECEFESGPFLLDLPLGTNEVVVATGSVPAGTYTELEFEVEDLHEDDDDNDFDAVAALRQAMRAAYPNFPDEASMVVRGTFTPTGGTPTPFTVYLDAEIEVETDLVPPFVVDGDGNARTLTVRLDPAGWFLRNGQVMDLSAFDGQRMEFEAEFEDGVLDVEWDDDD